MKVYVEDLLVKNCICCDFCYTNSQGCVCKLTGHITRYDEPLEEMRRKCPLLSLADYTKQVREEVCQKIRENAISHNNLEVDMYYITPQQLYEIERGETECQKN